MTRNESCYVFVAFFVRLFTLLRRSKKKRPYKKNISIVLHFLFLLFFAGTISLIMPGSSFATGNVSGGVSEPGADRAGFSGAT